MYINGPGHMTKMAAMPIYGNQRTNGPVNSHLSLLQHIPINMFEYYGI